MSIAPGLCSITFRSLDADAVLDLAVRAGVEGIEWGADGHAPPGGGASVARLAARCRDAGVDVVSYGSYLGFGSAAGDDPSTVDAVLDSAEALGAPMVRLWTELGVGPDAAATERARVAARTAAYVDAIASRGLVPTLEFHPYTLTETAASAIELLDALDRDGVRTHWQPDPSWSADHALAELAQVAPRLAHVHVFAWGPEGIGDRRALVDGADLWTRALALADREGAAVPGGRFALCEYVRDDDPDQFVADAAVLRSWGPPPGGAPPPRRSAPRMRRRSRAAA
jgi:3-dehydroshikimate dehydratase